MDGTAFIGGRPRDRRPIPKDTATSIPTLSSTSTVVPALSALTLASQSRQKALKERGEMNARSAFDDT